jgi:hypothetical protein
MNFPPTSEPPLTFSDEDSPTQRLVLVLGLDTVLEIKPATGTTTRPTESADEHNFRNRVL